MDWNLERARFKLKLKQRFPEGIFPFQGQVIPQITSLMWVLEGESAPIPPLFSHLYFICKHLGPSSGARKTQYFSDYGKLLW